MSEPVAGPAFVMFETYGACLVLLALYFWWQWRQRKKRGPLSPFSRAVDNPKAALMPLDYIKPPTRKVGELPVGDAAHVDWSIVSVNPRGAVFLSIESYTKIYEEPSWHTVEVLREQDGWVLKLRSGDDLIKFTPQPLYSANHYEPVIRIEMVQAPVH